MKRNLKFMLDTIETSAVNTITELIPVANGHFGFGHYMRRIAICDANAIIEDARQLEPNCYSWLPQEKRMPCDIE